MKATVLINHDCDLELWADRVRDGVVHGDALLLTLWHRRERQWFRAVSTFKWQDVAHYLRAYRAAARR